MKPATRRRLKLLAGVGAFYIALWLLWYTPVIFPLKIFVVLLHEISHALAALASGGAVERIVLDMNQGGATYVLGGNSFLVLSAGYLGSLLWGLLLIELAGARTRYARWAVGVLGGFVLLVAALYLRNLFGFIFTGQNVGGAIAPVLLGTGEHLLQGLDLARLGYRVSEHVASAKATHVVLTHGRVASHA